MPKWKPNLSNTIRIDAPGSLLQLAAEKFAVRYNEYIIKPIKDAHGQIAYLTANCVLCAKSYIFGSIVSCHEALCDLAIELNKELVMYIDKNNAFYQFDPFEVLLEGQINQRGGFNMINFSIKLGKKYQ